MQPPKLLSWSALRAFEWCPAQWALSKIIRLPFELAPAAAVGVAVHQILAGLPTSDDFHALWVDAALENPSVIRHKQQVFEMVAKACGWDLARNAIIGTPHTEVKVAGQVAGIDMRGVIDLVELTDEGAICSDWKGLAVDTPIPTPTGWKTMGGLRVGDHVFGSDGKPVAVINKSQVHNRPCYQVEMSDKSTVIADNVHLWQVQLVGAIAGRKPSPTLVVNTEELAALLAEEQRLGRPESVIIANPSPLHRPETTVPVDPYLLGLWLGDGTSKSGDITVGDQDLAEMTSMIRQFWPSGRSVSYGGRPTTVTLSRPHPDLCVRGHDIKDRLPSGTCRLCARVPGIHQAPWNLPFAYHLKCLNVLRNKHIPEAYLEGSVDQRIALVQGLMDTDGYWNPSRGRVQFTTSSPRLADGVTELLRSLGITVSSYTFRVENAVRPDSDVWYLEFRPSDFNPFRLKRKADCVKLKKRIQVSNGAPTKAARRSVRSVTPVDSVPTQCIAVDAADSLYVCGEAHLVTHNTGALRDQWSGIASNRQVVLYSLLLGERYGPVSAARIYYLADQEMIEVDLTGEYGDYVRAEATQFVTVQASRLREACETGLFEVSPGEKCLDCRWLHACPAGARPDPKLPVPVTISGSQPAGTLAVGYEHAVEEEGAEGDGGVVRRHLPVELVPAR